MRLTSWKTTSAGVLMIVGGITAIIFQIKNITQELVISSVTSILGGLGLLFAKDSNVTGVGQGAVTLKELEKGAPS
jgi:hypothetical protein